MGSSQSAPESHSELLNRYSSTEQRMLLRNCSLLAGRDAAEPTSFGHAEWIEVHGALGTPLASALFHGFAGGDDGVLSFDIVIRTLVRLREVKAARLQFLEDASSAPAIIALSDEVRTTENDSQLSGAVRAIRADGGPWLRKFAPRLVTLEVEEWLVQLGKYADDAMGGSLRDTYGTKIVAAEMLARIAEASWLVDHRNIEPLPNLNGMSSEIIPPHAFRPLTAALPPAYRRSWRLLFSTTRDGASFTRLCNLTFGRAPCLFVLRDKGQATFGAFCPEPLHLSPKFFGDFSSFLFRIGASSDSSRVFRASGDNSNFVYCNAHKEMLPNGIAFGGNLDSRFFGLWL
mmetsp:Transcript_19411/g.58586  ORF Transcript_19411/g.58586 Transcript_19411/m.58586 type:complete len:345 (+) Transcript_19411:150-1184(+)